MMLAPGTVPERVECDGDPEGVLGNDQMLDVMLRWLINPGMSSAWRYRVVR
jgi:hypothetical protein